MAYGGFQPKDMTGAIFVNDKRDNEKSPTHSGSLLINGTTYRVAGWKRTSKAGKNYLSLAIEVDDGKRKNRDEW